MQTALNQMLEEAKQGDFESVWLVMSSHGDWETFCDSEGRPLHQADVIWGTDRTVPIHLLTEKLRETSKPGVIVIQACRGDQLAPVCTMQLDDKGKVLSSEVTKAKYSLASDRDRSGNTWPELDSYYDNQILLCSSTAGNAAFREPLFPYLQGVLDEEDLVDVDVEQIFEKTCAKVSEEFTAPSGRKTTAEYFSKLIVSKLYLQ
eukprot:GHVO01069330.1.p1 GENE.GHVO01069330.1~~GHVO01069330.1.p1  ORF type:complete len:216 (+),score=16.07 GHVO01069330.1:37-648(+)